MLQTFPLLTCIFLVFSGSAWGSCQAEFDAINKFRSTATPFEINTDITETDAGRVEYRSKVAIRVKNANSAQVAVSEGLIGGLTIVGGDGWAQSADGSWKAMSRTEVNFALQRIVGGRFFDSIGAKELTCPGIRDFEGKSYKAYTYQQAVLEDGMDDGSHPYQRVLQSHVTALFDPVSHLPMVGIIEVTDGPHKVVSIDRFRLNTAVKIEKPIQ
ncbi:hypothetical protein RMR16_024825 (plasmid) [Agrobacterium sp. rho-13.3]|uniref:hypothetical protein n=1 Tax=Agrobacterium sp. rho-13.3 TaxID=3072980 RepID=UPI002A133D97|nr:hypothetical protein [Agrobacterium sp. rho-13.3]MDX8310177.1 hypothetical protein [Agrobacterium sp. rho-13.3]